MGADRLNTQFEGAKTAERDDADPELKASLRNKLFGEKIEPSKIGRYLVTRRIGTGGTGRVYSGFDPELDRKVAIKLLHPGKAGDEQMQARLLREAQALAKLTHPNVVTVHDVGVHENQVFLVMELVAGATLKEWMAQGPRPWRDVIEVFVLAGRGLLAAHAAELVHRDFKPANVLMGEQGRVQVADFGLVRATTGEYSALIPLLKQWYQRRVLPEFKNILGIIKEGKSSGVFYLQLHGMEHYWPPALMQAQDSNKVVRDWLISNNKTEDLPSHLQSRWSNGSQLPSKEIEVHDIHDYVMEECDLFNTLFGYFPVVVVPPTFDWNMLVERAWLSHGIQTIITPGMKFDGRDKEGKLILVGDMIFNGQQSNTGLNYLVRDNYFEPAHGHKAEDVEQSISRKSELARPVLLEMHRFNYYEDTTQASLSELDRMISRVCEHFPQINFMTTEVLIQIINNRDSNYLIDKLTTRTGYWVKRMMLVSGLQKWIKLSGAIIVFKLLAIVFLPKSKKQI